MLIIKTLKRFKFGPNFVDWIQTLYSSSQVSVRVNGYRSARFKLERGYRQGCPLSPLLFAISIEPLAHLIRDNDEIKGILTGSEEHKISLYADDVLLYLTNSISSIPRLKEMISIYGYFSGYKINVDKTEAMDVNSNIPLEVKQQSSFKWPREGIKYLGINIPLSLNDLFHGNYGKALNIIKKDLERWSALPLSLLGHIETIRMNLPPRLLYLFQM